MAEYVVGGGGAQYRVVNPWLRGAGLVIAGIGAFILLGWLSGGTEITDLLVSLGLIVLGGYLFFDNTAGQARTAASAVSVEDSHVVNPADSQPELRRVEQRQVNETIVNEEKRPPVAPPPGPPPR